MSQKYTPIEDVVQQSSVRPSQAPQPYVEGRFVYDFVAFPNELVFQHIKGIKVFSQVITLVNTGLKDIFITDIEFVGAYKIVGRVPDRILRRQPTSLLIQYDPKIGDGSVNGGMYISCKDSVGKAFIRMTTETSEVSASTDKMVQVVPQSFSTKEKETARANIGAMDAQAKVVLYTKQNLTEDEKAQARLNIGVTGTGGGGNTTPPVDPVYPYVTDFKIHRGINMDTWIAWPPPEQWNNPSVILPFPEWRKHLLHKDFYNLKESGYDFVRMTVDPAPFLAPQSAPMYSQLVDSVMTGYRELRGAGLKVIIDLHAIPDGRPERPGVSQILDNGPTWEKYIKLIEDFAKRLANEDPRVVAFETMNEPNQGNAPNPDNTWLNRQLRMYNTFRQFAKNIPIILTGSDGGSASSLVKVNPNQYGSGKDKNIIWTYHSYAPFLITHQGAEWAGDVVRYMTGLPYPMYSISKAEYDQRLEAVRQNVRDNAPANRKEAILAYIDQEMAKLDTPEKQQLAMREPMRLVAEWAKQYNISPTNLFLGEFGMIRNEYGNPYVVPPEERAAFYKDMLTLAEDLKHPWCMWSFGGAFGIIEEFEWRPGEPNVIDMVRALPKLPIMTI